MLKSYRKILGLCLVATLTLSGCGYIKNIAANLPEFDDQPQTKDEVVYDLSRPPEDLRNTQAALKTMNGAKGLNNHEYLSQEVRGSISKLGEMRQTLTNMQNDMQVVQPTMQRVQALQSEVNLLNRKFENMLNVIQGSAPVHNTDATFYPPEGTSGWTEADQRPMQIIKARNNIVGGHAKPMQSTSQQVRKAAPSRTTYAPSIPSGVNGLIDIRVGEHKNKTRLVLDMASTADARYDLDKTENVMIVEIPGKSAAHLKSKSFAKSRLLKGYDVQKSGDNTIVVFMFKKPTSVLETMKLKGRGNSAHRIVFDLAK